MVRYRVGESRVNVFDDGYYGYWEVCECVSGFYVFWFNGGVFFIFYRSVEYGVENCEWNDFRLVV